MGSRRARRLAALAVLAIAAPAVVACGSDSGSSGGGQSASAAPNQEAPAGKKYKVVMSIAFVGIPWRQQHMNIPKAMAANNAPFKGNVDFSVVIADQTPTAQIQSLNNIIAQKPDAILINASSPTALNPTIQKACAQGIVVVGVDQVPTAPCAYKVRANEPVLFENNAQWLINTIGGKGNILVDGGLPGQPITIKNQAANKKILGQSPDIKVVSTYEGQYAAGPSKQAVSSILSSGKKVDGVLGFAGVDGAVAAFLDSKTKPVPMTNYGDTSVRLVKTVQQNLKRGLEFNFSVNPPTLSGYGLYVAWQVLHKQNPLGWGLEKDAADPKDFHIPAAVYNTNGKAGVDGVKVMDYQELIDKYGDQPGDLQLPFSIPESPVTPEQALGTAK